MIKPTKTHPQVVQEVLAQLGKGGGDRTAVTATPTAIGLFRTVDDAVAAATQGFERFRDVTMEDRAKAIASVYRISTSNPSNWARWRWKRRRSAGSTTRSRSSRRWASVVPGVEFLRSEVFSGDHGLAVIEHAPFGVIGAITPGDPLAADDHRQRREHDRRPATRWSSIRIPAASAWPAEGVRRFNEAIYRDLGIDNLICVITEPTLETAAPLFKHRGVQADLRHRRAGRGPGGHAASEAGDRGRAGQSARGRRRNGRPGPRRPLRSSRARAYDNNLLCIAEKEVFVVEPMFDAAGRHGAGRRPCGSTAARSTP